MTTFEVEVLLKGTDEVVTETVTYSGHDPQGWTDADVREILLSTLRVFERVNSGDEAAGTVALRGLSWIVTEAPGGVAKLATTRSSSGFSQRMPSVDSA